VILWSRSDRAQAARRFNAWNIMKNNRVAQRRPNGDLASVKRLVIAVFTTRFVDAKAAGQITFVLLNT